MVKREKKSVNRKRLVDKGSWRMGTLLKEAESRLARAGVESSQREAQDLLGRVLHLSRTRVLTSPDQPIGKNAVVVFEKLLNQRLRRRPLQYVLGEEGFWGATFCVGEGVLIPRPETELLIEEAVRIGQTREFQRIVDLGTGSGILALTLARIFPKSAVMGVDISKRALFWARKNSRRLRVANCQFRLSDADRTLPKSLKRSVSLVVSNPPYIPRRDLKQLQPEVQYEPALALDGGVKGTEKIERMLAAAERLLENQGVFICEIGIHQAHDVKHLFTHYGFAHVHEILDWQNIPRIISGVKSEK